MVKYFPADPPGEFAVVHGDGGRVAGAVLRHGASRVRRSHFHGHRRPECL